MNFSPWLPRFCADTTREDGRVIRGFGMNRRDMMKLVSLATLPMMPGAAMARADSNTPPLRYKVFTVTRPGLNRDVPLGKEPLMWVANSATLIYGEHDAVLVDTFLTVEQCNGVCAPSHKSSDYNGIDDAHWATRWSQCDRASIRFHRCAGRKATSRLK